MREVDAARAMSAARGCRLEAEEKLQITQGGRRRSSVLDATARRDSSQARKDMRWVEKKLQRVVAVKRLQRAKAEGGDDRNSIVAYKRLLCNRKQAASKAMQTALAADLGRSGGGRARRLESIHLVAARGALPTSALSAGGLPMRAPPADLSKVPPRTTSGKVEGAAQPCRISPGAGEGGGAGGGLSGDVDAGVDLAAASARSVRFQSRLASAEIATTFADSTDAEGTEASSPSSPVASPAPPVWQDAPAEVTTARGGGATAALDAPARLQLCNELQLLCLSFAQDPHAPPEQLAAQLAATITSRAPPRAIAGGCGHSPIASPTSVATRASAPAVATRVTTRASVGGRGMGMVNGASPLLPGRLASGQKGLAAFPFHKPGSSEAPDNSVRVLLERLKDRCGSWVKQDLVGLRVPGLPPKARLAPARHRAPPSNTSEASGGGDATGLPCLLSEAPVPRARLAGTAAPSGSRRARTSCCAAASIKCCSARCRCCG